MTRLFLLFIIYSIIGWIIEMFAVRVETGKWANRGYLIGPACPIYGFGCIAIIKLLSAYADRPLALMVLSLFVCSTVEYFVSYLIEKLFKLRLWDYHDKKYNINGRICLEFAIPFALLGALVIYAINPFLNNMLDYIPSNISNIIAIIASIILFIDTIISSNVLLKIKSATNNLKKDSTEDVKKALKKYLRESKYLYKRLLNAFPTIYRIIRRKKKRD